MISDPLRLISIDHLTLIAAFAAASGACFFFRGFRGFVPRHSTGSDFGIQPPPALPHRSADPPAHVGRYDETAAVASVSVPPPEIIRLSGGPLPSSTKEMTQQGKIAAALNRAGVANRDAWAVTSGSTSGSSLGLAVCRAPERLPVPQPQVPPANSTTSNQKDNGKEKEMEAPTPSSSRPNVPLALTKGRAEDIAATDIPRPRPQEISASLDWKSVVLVVGGTGLTMLGLGFLLLAPQLR